MRFGGGEGNGGSGGDGGNSGSGGGETQQVGVEYINDGKILTATISSGSQIIINNVNGNPVKNNPEIISTIDKINYTKNILYESLKEEFLEVSDDNEVLKDIIENGIESDYLKAFDASTREYLSSLATSITDTAKTLENYNGDAKKIVDYIKEFNKLWRIGVPGLNEAEYAKAMKTYNNIRDMFREDLSLEELLDNSHEPDIKKFKQSGIDRFNKIKNSKLSV